jgi:putative FmdB family regulatory protein
VPTYQYACTTCGEQLEVVQKFTDEPLTACPACGGSLRKIYSAVGIVFKGSGFYRTDSRAEAKKVMSSVNGSSRGSAYGTSSESTSSTDSKPASETAKPAASSGPKSATTATS